MIKHTGHIYTATLFLSAFLLFSSELMLGKILLALFGGYSTVWTTVLFFFMTVVFLGYSYASWLLKKPRKIQNVIHGALIAAVLGVMGLSGFVSGGESSSPALSITIWLTEKFGIVAFLLSSTSTLLQGWHGTGKSQSPYSLYAFSNAGSLAALVLYPFVIEPLIPLHVQQVIWKIGILIYSTVMMRILLDRSNKAETHIPEEKERKIPASQSVRWLILSFIGNSILIATTAHITKDIAPIPLVWISPLVLYLMSFILPFSLSWKGSGFPYYACLIPTAIYALVPPHLKDYIILGVGLELIMIFGLFLALHTALYEAKPSRVHLGPYYMMIAVGGCVAGFVCTFIAPAYFSDLWEFPISIGLAVILIGTAAMASTAYPLRKAAYMCIAAGTVLVFAFSQRKIFTIQGGVLEQSRNFYGQIIIGGSDDISRGGTREMANGGITHGSQDFGHGKERVPLTYYTEESGLGISIKGHAKRVEGQPMRIGGIGLGVGTIAAYCQAGDVIKFYEINPVVITYADTYFTYLSDCKKRGGTVEIAEGDARKVLEKERETNSPQGFDILVVDAFSGDSVPFHLMTKEALQLYLSHLSEDGVVAYHISNKYMNFLPQLNAQAISENLFIAEYRSGGSFWVMMTQKELTEPLLYLKTIPSARSQQIWTDDYTNILDAVVWIE